MPAEINLCTVDLPTPASSETYRILRRSAALRTDARSASKEATDRAKELGVGAADIAPHLGIKPHTFRLMQLEGEHGRTPVPEWQAKLVVALTQRVAELVELRDEIENSKW